jgi:hypothetical protein
MMSSIVDGIKALTQPITKLIEVISKGIGILYEPKNIRKIAKAKAEEIEIIGEAARKNLDLPLQYSDGKLMITTVETKDLCQRTALRQNYQEIQKQQNIESVIMVAAEQLKDEERVSDEPVDADWATRFFNIVGEVSNEEVQHIWGKILAGEIKTPGTFSLRTLESLRNLSQKEAEVFSEVAGFVFRKGTHCFIIANQVINYKFGLRFEDIVLLEGCGLISAQEIELCQLISIKQMSNESDYIFNDKYIYEFGGGFSCPIYKLTESGREIFSVIEKNINEKYTFQCFCFDNCSWGVKIHLINSISSLDGSIDYNEELIPYWDEYQAASYGR